jgi:hypothetical protein
MSGQPIAVVMATIAIVGVTLIAAGVPALAADEGAASSRAGATVAATEAYAQARARTRIRVSPRCYYRTRALTYPPPYECEAPGPGYVRQCNSWLVQEARPSGTVIVPRMQCWWERG